MGLRRLQPDGARPSFSQAPREHANLCRRHQVSATTTPLPFVRGRITHELTRFLNRPVYVYRCLQSRRRTGYTSQHVYIYIPIILFASFFVSPSHSLYEQVNWHEVYFLQAFVFVESIFLHPATTTTTTTALVIVVQVRHHDRSVVH